MKYLQSFQDSVFKLDSFEVAQSFFNCLNPVADIRSISISKIDEKRQVFYINLGSSKWDDNLPLFLARKKIYLAISFVT